MELTWNFQSGGGFEGCVEHVLYKLNIVSGYMKVILNNTECSLLMMMRNLFYL